jgi:hypothetical protein
MPDNRGFYGFSKGKSHKNLQVQQAPRVKNFGFGKKIEWEG